ncbi:MAG: DegT/DnrJ/EryC1/StrS family aminotransferase, partial [Cyclobacteriaceae bacterium]|nr:DegT/DnrJ/EryC1/StrS family aminotransferase [Cyclobacteriaceae bacterium]
IIAVHLYGMPAKMDEILTIAKRYEIPLVEDAAESLGSTFNSKKSGTLGDIGIYSFNGNKIITTSGGGALVSENEKWVKRAKFLATQARDPAPHYQHSEIGYNYRLSNISAGIGRGQLKKLDERIRQKRANFEFYQENLSSIPGIAFQPELTQSFSNRWLTCIAIESSDNQAINPDKIRLALEAENIESRPLWKPMHLQPLFSPFPAYERGVSANLFKRGLCLPSSTQLTDADKDRIISVIRGVKVT